jgi:hypothetical protein
MPCAVHSTQPQSSLCSAPHCSYSSDDPLDLGEALWLSHWQLGQQQQQQQPPQALHGAAWAQHISKVSLSSLDRLWSDGYFDEPLQWRLGFREFGTSIGLQVSTVLHSCTSLMYFTQYFTHVGYFTQYFTHVQVSTVLHTVLHSCTSLMRGRIPCHSITVVG